ncbi:MAG TPA: hypothetical protein VFN51_03700, partial [Candidatus Saccharimonadales bacterium]|nr:hypothetical protein [Candidatus Saccharimonadales bacterium]
MKILYTQDQIEDRIADMAQEIVAKYDPKTTVFVSLLNGAVPFTFLLMQAILRLKPEFHPNVQHMYVSRYGDNREAGKLKVIDDLPPDYRDLHGRQ